MENNKIVNNPSTSGISISLDFPLLEDLQNLVNKYREKFESAQKINTAKKTVAKLVALLTEDDPMLSTIVVALQKNLRRLMRTLLISNTLPEIYTNPTDCCT